MDDLLTIHAERVGQSRQRHEASLIATLQTHDAALADEFSRFVTKLNEIMDLANAAANGLVNRVNEIGTTAVAEARAAFAVNMAEVAASGAAMDAEMRQRAAFLMTGKLPVEDVLPKSETPEVLQLPEAAE